MNRAFLSLMLLLGFAGRVPLLLADTNPAHWAFVPPKGPPVPAVKDDARVRTAVDRFLEAALEKHGLSLGPESDRATLLRRVCFDLTGLPPTPAQIAAFVGDTSADAYERMV